MGIRTVIAPRRRVPALAVILGGTALAVACVPPPPTPPSGAVTVVAAGDIACSPEDIFFNGGLGDSTHCRMKATSDLALRLQPDLVLALGDLQYRDGTLAEFQAVYHSTWGRMMAITRPVPGNHEHQTPGAAGYLEYFGAAATPDGTTWYSFDVGSWHVVALDSTCARNGGCGPSSAQGRWLAADLAADDDAGCTLALWHHPPFSSAPDGGTAGALPLWRAAVGDGVDLVLSGHRHHYERFTPLDSTGAIDPTTGTRLIVSGTGGNDIEAFGATAPGSQARIGAFGVLELELDSTEYRFRFVGIDGVTMDSGGGTCTT